MIKPGQVVLFRFPHTDLQDGKLRPTLLVAKVPGRFDDWLACAISTQLQQQVPDFDEIIREGDDDYAQSNLKSESLIRIGRLGVLEGSIFKGAIGEISTERLRRIKARLTKWLGE
ncbi:MAG: type II toxin-antitoxin system PemK/MazF family toxin [Chloroflexota bacterium]